MTQDGVELSETISKKASRGKRVKEARVYNEKEVHIGLSIGSLLWRGGGL